MLWVLVVISLVGAQTYVGRFDSYSDCVRAGYEEVQRRGAADFKCAPNRTYRPQHNDADDDATVINVQSNYSRGYSDHARTPAGEYEVGRRVDQSDHPRGNNAGGRAPWGYWGSRDGRYDNERREPRDDNRYRRNPY